MYKVFFVMKNKREKQIGKCDSIEKAVKVVEKFCKDNDYIPPYLKMFENTRTGETVIDAGSSWQYFRLDEEDK